MKTTLQHLIPTYLEKEKVLSSEIWDHDISLQRYTHIVAPSGRGKSSLIQFMYGIRKEYTGDIWFDDEIVQNKSPEALADLRSSFVSIVFQDLRLFPDHTAYENIAVKRSLMPFEDDRIRAMAARLGVENKLQQKIKNCSYGEQQRFAIIRALQQPFKLLILDEPFSHLDENNSRMAMELILEETQKRSAQILLMDLDKVSFFPADVLYHL